MITDASILKTARNPLVHMGLFAAAAGAAGIAVGKSTFDKGKREGDPENFQRSTATGLSASMWGTAITGAGYLGFRYLGGKQVAKKVGSLAAAAFKDDAAIKKTVGRVVSTVRTLTPSVKTLKRTAVGAAIVGAVYLGSQGNDPGYQSEDTAVPDGMGGYQTQTGVRDRMNRIGGRGDLVFGMHNGRHK